jgi:hypothetical protein
MNTYIVTSDRLAGFRRGDVISDKDLEGANVEALLDAGHIVEHVSAQTVKKSAKTKDIETEKD